MTAKMEGRSADSIPAKPPSEVIIRLNLKDEGILREKLFGVASQKISMLADKLNQVANDEFVEKLSVSEFRRLTNILDEIETLKDNLAEDQVIRFFNLGLSPLRQRLKELLQMDIWDDHSEGET